MAQQLVQPAQVGARAEHVLAYLLAADSHGCGSLSDALCTAMRLLLVLWLPLLWSSDQQWGDLVLLGDWEWLKQAGGWQLACG